MPSWFPHVEWFGNSLFAWVIAGAAAFAGYVLAHGFALLLRSRLDKLAERTGRPGVTIAASVASATRGWLLLLIAIVVALNFLQFPDPIPMALRLVAYALIGVQIAFWLTTLVVSWIKHATSRHGDKPVNEVIIGILTWMIQFVIWVTLLLAVLSYGGVPITSFVASLGVGGIAVALAAQNVLSDLFASISIGLDEPFEVGDYIAFGNDQGTVVKVGVRSTRVRSLSGEELVVANSDLVKHLIHNYSRRSERRVLFTFRLPFDTPRDRIPEVVARVRGFIENEQPTRFDRGYLSGFGDSGLDFEFVYYVLDPAYNTYVDIQQSINLKMLEAWDELGIEFAVPARKVHASGAVHTTVGAADA